MKEDSIEEFLDSLIQDEEEKKIIRLVSKGFEEKKIIEILLRGNKND